MHVQLPLHIPFYVYVQHTDSLYACMWQELNVSFNLSVYLFILSTMSDLLADHILCAKTLAFANIHSQILCTHTRM